MTRAPVLHALLARAARRIGLLAALNGAAVGVACATVWNLRGFVSPVDASPTALTPTAFTLIAPLIIAGAVGAVVGWMTTTTRRERIARDVEARVPAAANLLVTADELNRDDAASAAAFVTATTTSATTTASTPAAVTAMVTQRAERLAATLDVSALFPATQALQRAAASLALWIGVTALVSRVDGGPSTVPLRAAVAAVTGRADIQRVRVRITPPAYTRRADSTLRDPARIEALAGSRIALSIDASADTLLAVIAHGGTSEQLRVPRSADGTFTVTVPGDRDGYIALEPLRAGDTAAAVNAGARRLIGLTIRSDEAPRVRIVAPARDLIVPDAKRTIDVRVESDDDLAMASLTLRYTKVSGSGERFTFSEGQVPVTVARTSRTQWNARAALALESLLQEPGDLVVYRAVATDSRPGSPGVESDAFIAELAAPGGVAALGFSLDPDEDRYALSQQMVILKTEKLIAKRATMPAAALAEEAAQLAGEQRRVRAEFVFMMGGEFAQEVTGEDASGDLDETHEAESEGELADGRMANKGRASLLAAVRAMSRAAVALTVADLAPALASEKSALKQLQDAFARQRFLMRALSQREQLDPARRLTGKLDSIARGRTQVGDGERDVRVADWRRILSDVQRSGDDRGTGAPLVLLAERVLQLDPSSAGAQRIATQLNAAGASGSAATARRALLDSATIGITAIVRASLRPAAVTLPTRETRQLQSELEASLDAVRANPRDTRRGGGRP